MNQNIKRICVIYNNKRVILIFNHTDDLQLIIHLCLQKHKLQNVKISNFYLILEKFDCIIENAMDIQDDDTLILAQYTDNLGDNEDQPKLSHLSKDLYNGGDNDDLFNITEIQMVKDEEEKYQPLSSNNSSKSNSSEEDFYEFSSEEIEEEEHNDLLQEDTQEEEEEEKTDHEAKGEEIDIETLKNEEFSSRSCLSTKVKEWAARLKFSVRFENGEKITPDDRKISLMTCSKENCPFFLQFQTEEINKPYKLVKYWNQHDHVLIRKDTGRDITPDIFSKIKDLMNSVTDNVKLASLINKEFKKNFSVDVIRHQIRIAKIQEYGKPSEDAQELINLLSEDSRTRGYYFKKMVLNNQLQRICFMTPCMIQLANICNNVIIIDTTHKTNRFNMPMLDVIIIDNLGRSRTIFVALLDSQKIDSFKWALESLKEKLSMNPPVIFSDEDEALLSGRYIF